jgi:hypothetical protein
MNEFDVIPLHVHPPFFFPISKTNCSSAFLLREEQYVMASCRRDNDADDLSPIKLLPFFRLRLQCWQSKRV